MKIKLVNDLLSVHNGTTDTKKCFYFKIIDSKNIEISSDFAVSALLGIEQEEYVSRLIKTFNNSYTIKKRELYLTFDNLSSLSEKELIDRFKEEFFSELISAKLSN